VISFCENAIGQKRPLVKLGWR